MGKKKFNSFQIESKASTEPSSVVADLDKPSSSKKVGVNLRYFQRRHECFSTWVKDDLKAFSNWVAKMADRTEAQITSNTQTCHAHLGKTKTPELPRDVSPDIKMYNLDVGRKSRVHGFFSGGDFYLVWLDRSHSILNG